MPIPALLLLALLTPPASPSTFPAAPRPVLLRDVRVLTGPGATHERTDVLLRDGVVAAIGGALSPPSDADVVEGGGKVLVPGFVDAWSTAFVAAPPRSGSDDGGDERSERPPPDEGVAWGMPLERREGLTPEHRAADALEEDDEAAAALRRAGVTAVLVVPDRRGLAGLSALVEVGDGGTADRLLRDEVFLHLSLSGRRGSYPSTSMGVLAHTRQFLADARWNREQWERYERLGRTVLRPRLDPAWRAVLPALDGERAVVIEADSARAIGTALDFAEEQGLDLVVAGAGEAYRVVDRLAASGARVLLGLDWPDDPAAADAQDDRTDDLPQRVLEDRAAARRARVRTARVLAEAGVPFAFCSRGLEGPGELLGRAREAVAAGLPRGAALAALTSAPAALLGVGDVLGAVRVGGQADLALFSDDPFAADAVVERVYVRGRAHEVGEKGEDARRGRAGRGRRGGREDGGDDDAGGGGGRIAAALPTEIDADRVEQLRTGGDVVVRNGTVHPISGPVLEGASVVIEDGRIARVVPAGAPVEPPDGAVVIDATGMHVTPGLVDCHSHIAITGGVNEATDSITCEVTIADQIDGDDPAIFRAAAGGCTTANLLHGSANAIGGRNAVVKMKYRRPARELLVADAAPGVKFALGENPKRSNSSRGGERYPSTRLGVEATIRRAFVEARAYAAAWRAYRDARARGVDAPIPRTDLRLETLAGVLDGSVRVHSHCYRADEILMLLRVAEEFGFRVATFQHVLEGYKVAPEMAAHGAAGSTFSDWWAYKAEAYDAIPYNAALMHRAGVSVSLNSDSSELMRRLNGEAAKAVKYGGVDAREALAMVTREPAEQLGVGHRVGTIEPGKDGDLAIWNGDPLSVYSRCEWTLIEGEVAFQRRGHPTALDAPIAPPSDDGFETSDAFTAAPVPRTPRVAPGGGRIALVGGRVHPVSSGPIDDGTVLMRDGRIERVGRGLDAPPGYEVVDCRGRHVYPGMIDPATQLGTTEIGSVAGTVDTREQGAMQPDLRSAVAVNPASAHVPVARANGVTSAVVRPRGSLVAGQSVLVRLDGWTWEEMAVVEPLALHVQTPSEGRRGRFRRGGRGGSGPTAEDRERELLAAFEEARAYGERVGSARAAGAEAPDVDPRLEALLPYARGEQPVVFDADDEAEIVKAVELAHRLGVRPIVSGGREAWKVAGLLERHDVPVLLGPVLSNPRQRHDPYDAPFAAAAVLARAGVRFAFQTNDSSGVRNLPYHAGMAAAFGLSRDEALRAVTLRPAEILGLGAALGSLEPGKIADVVVADGDLLELRTRVERVFVHGREVPVGSKHTRLYRTYEERLPAAPAVGTK